MEANLDRLDAGVAKRDAPARALVRLDELAARRVGEEAVGAAAEELPDRLAGRLADEIPDRSLDDPGPAAVEVDGLADLPHELRAERVEADEERLELGAIRECVAARPSREPLVRVNANERRDLMIARDRIPGCTERRVEVDAVASGLDGCDAHQLPP